MFSIFSAPFCIYGRISFATTRFSQLPKLKSTITMNGSVKLLRLEEKLTRTEVTVQKLMKDIESMKADLATLKNVRAGLDALNEPQKRSFSTSTSSSTSFIDLSTDNTATESDAKRTKFTFARNGEYVDVYTDGACTSNGQQGAKAGIGVWFGDDHPLNVSKPCHGRQTNNTAEIKAAAEACRVAAAHGVDKLQINTDSKFLIDCVDKWMPNWKQNNWKTAAGKDVVNKQDLMEFESSASQLRDVKLNHVPGHAGVRGNEGADRLAVRGTRGGRN